MRKFFTNRIVLSVIFFIVGFLIGTWLPKHNYIECLGKFSFINPIFACGEKNTVDKKSYEAFRSKLISYIDEQKRLGDVKEVSLFFRDLEAGPTMGINERVEFVPASLLKLPNALVLMRLQEHGEINIFTATSSYVESRQKSNEFIKPAYEILPNTLYTIDDLIFRSLAYSDNLANRLLIDYIEFIDNDRNLILEVYRDLGMLEIEDSISSAVNTKGYSTIFRLLFNSSFLNPEYSEKLLDMMSQSQATGGLRMGVPNNIKISHKYGERIINENENQLHDCGIVYYPENPYLLCVMTKGNDFEKLQEVISEISRQVYQEFDSRNLEKNR